MRIDKNSKIEITDFDFKGNGMGRLDGKPVFLDGGIIGDSVLCNLYQDKKSFYKGRVLRVIDYSKDRIKSKCPYSDVCGGCDFLEYPYNKQLIWKEEKVYNDLKRIAGIVKRDYHILGNESEYNYRNNIQLHVKNKVAGFYKKNSNEIVKVDSCLMVKPEINEAIEIIQSWNGLDSVNTVSIRSNYKGELMVVLVTKDGIRKENNLLSKLMDLNLVAVFENINKNSKYRFSNKFRKIYGKDYMIDKIGDFKFKLSPKSFFQVNPYQVEKLYNIAIDGLEIKKDDKIFDLYCGIGTLSLMAAGKGAEVIGVEIVEDAIADARENAVLNGIDVRFIAGKSEDIMENIIDNEEFLPNKVILDPPRGGVDEKLINKLIEIRPERISYISCNPSTQARDLSILESFYNIKTVQPVDMFSNTVHIENVVILDRK